MLPDKCEKTQIDPQHAPRVVRVLPDAQAVTERSTLEALYGIDLSKAKVIVTEFKLPLEKSLTPAPKKTLCPSPPARASG